MSDNMGIVGGDMGANVRDDVGANMSDDDNDDDDVGNNISVDVESNMDGEKDIDNNYISSDEEGLEFINVDENDWIGSLQADMKASIDDASSFENDLSNNSDEDDIDIEKGEDSKSSDEGDEGNDDVM
jgi:hypothetical protein